MPEFSLGDVLLELASQPNVRLEIAPNMALLLIGQLQLSLRHPANNGAAAEEVIRVIEQLAGAIGPPGSAVRVLIDLGWNPEYDRGPEDEPLIVTAR
jgi:hypothetical protein